MLLFTPGERTMQNHALTHFPTFVTHWFSPFSRQAFRLLRIFKLLTAWRTPREQLVGVAKALMHTRPLLAIMSLYLVVVALLGMGILGRTMNSRDNFDDFGNAFVTAFQLLTVDQWQLLYVFPLLLPDSLRHSLYPCRTHFDTRKRWFLHFSVRKQ